MAEVSSRAKLSEPAPWEAVLTFWFGAESRPSWFRSGPDFDEKVSEKLGPFYARAVSEGLSDWEDSPNGALALVILLDQVPRNLHRGTAKAFASDAQAREVARRALAQGHDRGMTQEERLFLYLPFEHSEDLEDQNLAVKLMAELDEDPVWLDYAERHRVVIERFGRFPHRNAALGRASSDEELAFLKEPGSSF